MEAERSRRGSAFVSGAHFRICEYAHVYVGLRPTRKHVAAPAFHADLAWLYRGAGRTRPLAGRSGHHVVDATGWLPAVALRRAMAHDVRTCCALVFAVPHDQLRLGGGLSNHRLGENHSG